MRLPRMTTRRWIVVVAIAATFVEEIYREWKLSSQYRRTASVHRQLESVYRGGTFTGM